MRSMAELSDDPYPVVERILDTAHELAKIGSGTSDVNVAAYCRKTARRLHGTALTILARGEMKSDLTTLLYAKARELDEILLATQS